MDYAPGLYAQVDWAVMPDRVPYEEELRRVYAFLMALCYSRLLYVEFTLSCRSEDFMRAHRRGLGFFHGTPHRCVYDNLGTVVLDRRGRDITFVAERHRLQSGEPLAPARAAEEDRHVVADKSAT
jgi:transposase